MAKFIKLKVLNKFNKNTTNTYLIFRSKWEVDFAHFLDNNSNIKSWRFDYPFKYHDRYVTKKITTYFIDFYAETVNGDKVFFEVKPVSTLKEKARTRSIKYKKIHNHNYLKNISKFDSVVGYCKKNNMSFYLVDKSKKSFQYYKWDTSNHVPVLA